MILNSINHLHNANMILIKAILIIIIYFGFQICIYKNQ